MLDYPNELIVSITIEDINEGCRGNSNNCPIAKAIKRDYPNFRYVGVTPQYISVSFDSGCYPSDTGYHYGLANKELYNFVDNFDCRRKEVVPISFIVKRNHKW